MNTKVIDKPLAQRVNEFLNSRAALAQVPPPPPRLSLVDTWADSHFSPFGMYIALHDLHTSATIVEFKDEEVPKAIDDELIDLANLHRSLFDYAVDQALIVEAR